MTVFIVRRLLILPVTLMGLTLLVFGLLQLLDPGERAALYIRERPKDPDELKRVIEKYGLDRPVYEQYFTWLDEVVHGNLGFSQTTGEPVAQAITTYFPATLELTLWSIVPIVLGGVVLGMKAAENHNRLFDQAARVISILAFSLPGFVTALLLLLFFYGVVQWFPPGRLSTWADAAVLMPGFNRYTGMNTLDGLLNGRLDISLDALRHLVLPVITLTYAGWALLMRVMRSSMLDAVHEDYTTTARAKGLSERLVLGRHVRPNALIPTVTICGLLFAGLLSGGGIVETIFDYQGMGQWAVNAAIHLDTVAVLGATLLNGTLLVLANLVVDIGYAFMDPRIRLR